MNVGTVLIYIQGRSFLKKWFVYIYYMIIRVLNVIHILWDITLKWNMFDKWLICRRLSLISYLANLYTKYLESNKYDRVWMLMMNKKFWKMNWGVIGLKCLMALFNNILVLLVEETRVHGENHQPATSYW